jgi:hypothetical protein
MVRSIIQRLKPEVCASSFLVEIHPVKRADPRILCDKATHRKIQ